MGNGIVGLYILGDREFDHDALIAFIEKLKPAFVVVLNNSTLASELLTYTRVICRYTPDDGLPASGAAFVQQRRASVPNGAYLLVPNEPVASAALNQAILDAQTEAGPSLKLAILAFGTGNPQPADWDTLAPCMNNAVERGDLAIVHEYWYQTIMRDYPWEVGRYKTGKAKFPKAQFIIGEHGALNLDSKGNYDAEAGWGTYLTEQAYAGQLSASADLYAADDVPVIPYCWPEWDQHKFDLSQATEFVQPAMIAANAKHQWKGTALATPAPTQVFPAGSDPSTKLVAVASGLNLRSSPAGAIIYPLPVHAVVTVYAQPRVLVSGHTWVRVVDNAGAGAAGWCADDQGMNGGTSFADPPAPETNVVQVANVPYTSEFGWATGYTALCGETSLYMLLRLDRQGKLVALPPEITPLSIARYLGKGQKDFSSLQDLIHAGTAYGLALALMTAPSGQEFDTLIEQVKNGCPVIALIDYSKLPTRADQQFAGNHILVVIGVSDQSVIVNDPDSAGGVSGQSLHYPRADFLAAWTSLGSTGLILG